MNFKSEILMSMLLSIVISLILGKFIIRILRQKHIGQEIRDDVQITLFKSWNTNYGRYYIYNIYIDYCDCIQII